MNSVKSCSRPGRVRAVDELLCAPRECRPSLADVRPTDRTTPEQLFRPALAQRCGRRACRAPRKIARSLVAPRQNAAIARCRFRQARSKARTCGAYFDTVIDCTVEADWDRSSAVAADTVVDWGRSAAAVVDIAVDWNCSSVAEADIAVAQNNSWD